MAAVLMKQFLLSDVILNVVTANKPFFVASLVEH